MILCPVAVSYLTAVSHLVKKAAANMYPCAPSYTVYVAIHNRRF